MADMSSAESDGSLQAGFYANDVGSLDTARAVTRLVQGGEVDFAMVVGDLSYSTGFLSRWDAWMEMMQPIAARVPLMVLSSLHRFFCIQTKRDSTYHIPTKHTDDAREPRAGRRQDFPLLRGRHHFPLGQERGRRGVRSALRCTCPTHARVHIYIMTAFSHL